MINRIQNKSFYLHNTQYVSVLCIFVSYIYIKYTCIYIYMYSNIYIHIIYIINKYILLCKNHLYKVFEHSCVAAVCENNQPIMVKINRLVYFII